jgi:hypothetical protein
MPAMDGSAKTANLLATVLRDVHFWIPVAVLLGGMAVLRWIN